MINVGYCRDCEYNEDNDCTNNYMGERPIKSNHSLSYPYDEGAKFVTSELFGCVNFKQFEIPFNGTHEIN